MCTSRARRTQLGFTLVELIIFIVVVSVGIVGILKVMDTSVRSSADPMVRKQALALADSILEEVLAKSFADPDGTNVGETGRVDWDDVLDYNGKSNADFAPLSANLASYVIGIVVVNDGATLGVPALKVSVTITYGSEAVTISGYRTSY